MKRTSTLLAIFVLFLVHFRLAANGLDSTAIPPLPSGQMISVDDTTPPTFSGDLPTGDLCVQCNEIPTPPVLTATSDCAGGGGFLLISEFHYDNSGGDVGEFIEVSGTAGLDLSAYALVLYNGSNGTVYNTIALSGNIDDEGAGFGAINFDLPSNGLQNGSPDGIALVQGTTVIEFISYEGTLTAANGPASGLTSTNIGVSESSGTAVGQSLQASGTGNAGSDLTWSGPIPETRGNLNAGLTLVAPVGLFVVFTESTLPSTTCSQQDTLIWTWTATDPCGNTASLTQLVAVKDTLAPTFEAPADTVIDCDQNVMDLGVTGEITNLQDQCDNNPTVMFMDDVMLDGCGVIIRTFMISDACGNVVSAVQMITVQDTVPPTLSAPADGSVFCNQDPTDLTITGTPSDTSDNCTGMIMPIIWINELHYDNGGSDVGEFVEVAGNAGADLGPYALVFYNGNNGLTYVTIGLSGIIADESNGFGAISFAVTGIQNGSPDGIALISGTQVLEFISYEGTFTANNGPAIGMTSTDIGVSEGGGTNAGESLQKTGMGNMPGDFAWTGPLDDSPGNINAGQTMVPLPAGAMVEVSFDDVTDLTGCGGSGIVLRTWTATDACQNSFSTVQTITVLPLELDPQCQDVTVYLDESGVGTINVDSVFGGVANCDTVTLELDQDVVSCADEGTITVTLTVSDECETTATCTALVTVIDTFGPVINCPGNIYINLDPGACEQFVSYPLITATDVCSGEIDSANLIQIAGPPSGSAFQAESITTITFQATDASGNVSICSFDVIVNAFPDDLVATGVTCNDQVQVSVDEDCEAFIGADMILEGGPYRCYSTYLVEVEGYEAAPGGVLINNSAVGQLLTVTVTDPMNGNSCWGLALVEDKIAPTIVCTDVTLSCGESTEPVFIDAISGMANASTSPGLPIGPAGGVVTTEELQIIAPVDAEVTDVNISIELTHTWSSDLDVFLIGPDGTTVELATDVCGLGDDWDVTFDDEATVAVADACGGAPILMGTVQPEGFLNDFDGSPAAGIYTLMITDDTGGDGGTLMNVSLDVSFFVPLPYAASAEDACGEVTIEYNEEETGDDCSGFEITRVWTATDASGNSTSCDQTITIVPLTLEGLEFPATYEGECGGSFDPNITGWPTVDGVEITGAICNIFTGYHDLPLSDCGGGTKIVRKWSVLNWCTQVTVQQNQIIKLSDDAGPVLTCPPNVTVGSDPWYCVADVALPFPGADDACGTPFEWSVSASSGTIVPPFNFDPQYYNPTHYYALHNVEAGTTTVTWIALDACGNESTCSYTITVEDDVPPVASCDEHTIVSLTSGGPYGLTKVPAYIFDDGSYDNCSDLTFVARRMDSCIEFDWTTNGTFIDEIPGGVPPVNSRDRGTVDRPGVPFACCDVAAGPIMVQMTVTDASGNANSCMVEVEVQDKLPPEVICLPNVLVSCDFWFESTPTSGFVDQSEDVLTPVFGRMLDTYDYDISQRAPIIIVDPGNPNPPADYKWGYDGWAEDNCDVDVSVRVQIWDDCAGEDFPSFLGPVPPYAVRAIARTFQAVDGQGNINPPPPCRQVIWVVDFDPFVITDQVCGRPSSANAFFNSTAPDDVRWPCDIEIDDCPEGDLTPDNLADGYYPNNAPLVRDDNCSLIGVTYEDQRFDFVEDACYKIIREWTIIDWCQFDAQTGAGYWEWVQVIKVRDEEGATFNDCPDAPLEICVGVNNTATGTVTVTLPANNQVFLGEDDPNSSSCSAHVRMVRNISEDCSTWVEYDVKVYPNNGSQYLQVVEKTVVNLDENGNADLVFDTETSDILDVRRYGLPYNDPYCLGFGGPKDYHRILWSVEDGCGNLSTCQYLFRLDDCKKPSPVCINGLSSVVMPASGEVTIWAVDFNASSFDDCTPADDLLYSFSGSSYQPSRSFTCDDIETNGSPSFIVEIWLADHGNDENCNFNIEWGERNTDFCTTFIIIDDNDSTCDTTGSGSAQGIVQTHAVETVEEVTVDLISSNGTVYQTITTGKDGAYHLINPTMVGMHLEAERLDNPKNGVSTLDLVKIQKHLLGIEPFSTPYLYIAADANNSESVSAIDLIELRKLLLGIYTELPNNESWRFVDDSFVFADETNPWPFEENITLDGSVNIDDYIAVKVGDINNDVVANANQVVVRGAQPTMKLIVEEQVVEAGQTVTVAFQTEGQDLLGYQFTLQPSGLNFAGVEGGQVDVTEANFGLLKDAITTSWHSAKTVATNGTLFTLTFTATQSGNLSEMLRVNSRYTNAEAYDGAEETMDIALVFRSGEIEKTADFALYQNEPNPFNGATVIGFDLPEAGAATVTFFDITGKVLNVVEGEYTKGYNEVKVSSKNLSSTGVLYYRLDADEYTATKKMVVVER